MQHHDTVLRLSRRCGRVLLELEQFGFRKQLRMSADLPVHVSVPAVHFGAGGRGGGQ